MTMVGNGIFACVDPCEKWWLRLRGNPTRSEEVSQAAFLLKAETMGFDVALPWGDNQKFDFVVWRGNGRAIRTSEGHRKAASAGIRSPAGACDAARREETVYEERYW